MVKTPFERSGEAGSKVTKRADTPAAAGYGSIDGTKAPQEVTETPEPTEAPVVVEEVQDTVEASDEAEITTE